MPDKNDGSGKRHLRVRGDWWEMFPDVVECFFHTLTDRRPGLTAGRIERCCPEWGTVAVA